jgi:hypothetical protein
MDTIMGGSKPFGSTKEFPKMSQPSGKEMLPHPASNSINFIDLADTFLSYAGKANYYLRINAGENGITAVSTVSLDTAFLDLTDTFASYSGKAGFAVVVNSGATGLEATAKPFLQGVNADFQLHEIKNIVIDHVTSNPATPSEGQLWYNTTTHILRYYDGTNNIDITNLGGNFHSLSSSSYLSTHEIPVYDTIGGAYHKITLGDLPTTTEFAEIDVDSGDDIVASSEGVVTLAGDGVLATFVGSLTPDTITLTLSTQTMNLIFAGPPSGSAAKPTFRAMVDADLPSSYHNAVWDTLVSTPLTSLVPYTGATASVDLGDQTLSTTGRATVGDITIVNTPVVSTDAATVGYVNLIVALGIFWVAAVEDIVSSLPGGTPASGLRYILSTNKKIYTANGSGGYDTPSATTTGTTCFVKSNAAAPTNEIGPYTYNGSDWVYIGAGQIHNDLSSIQGGTTAEYYHLTLAQHAVAIQAATDSLNGYLSSADWSYFDSKADYPHAHDDGIFDWSMSGNGSYVAYAAKSAGCFDSGAVAPSHTNRLNYDGYLYATKLYSANTEVSVTGHTHAESTITFTAITTNNVSITKHGYCPILPNDATKYLDGTGAWTVPAGSGGGSSLWSRSGTVLSTLNAGDKVAIGSTTPGTYMLHVTGNGYFTGAVQVNCDIRNKIVLGPVEDVLDNIMNIETIRFIYKDDEFKEKRCGFSAQNVNKFFPCVASYYEETDQYGIDPIGVGAMNTKAIQELRARFERRLELLENEFADIIRR